MGFSLTDQVASAGAMFLANIALARTQSKEDYGVFVLSYSVYTFLAGVHNAAILEPYTVYGAGKYSSVFPEYLKLMRRTNAVICLVLTALLAVGLAAVILAAPHWSFQSLAGLTIALGVLLSSGFWRRTYYIEQKAQSAATLSVIFLMVVCMGLLITAQLAVLNSFSILIVLALAWIAAALTSGRDLILGSASNHFLREHSGYWQEHWKYARWILGICFVFQLSTQGYYWLVAGFLSVKEVAEVRAMYMIVTPVDQFFVAMSYIVLPRMAFHYASRNNSSFVSLLKRYQWLTAAATIALFIAVLLVGRPMIHLVYGGKFDSAVPLLYVLAALPFINGIGNPLNLALKSMERSNNVFYAYFASGLVTCTLGVPMVRHYGVMGAGIGMLISAAAYSAVLAIAFLAARRGKAQVGRLAAES
jgi:O-antigen/teichoic acid export membrane protein